jgi:ABC-type dipeptide/oligopeptide/nickel transport system permease component
LMVQAVFSQDYSIVQGGCLVIAVIVALANLAVDISYSWLDPRIRYA